MDDYDEPTRARRWLSVPTPSWHLEYQVLLEELEPHRVVSDNEEYRPSWLVKVTAIVYEQTGMTVSDFVYVSPEDDINEKRESTLWKVAGLSELIAAAHRRLLSYNDAIVNLLGPTNGGAPGIAGFLTPKSEAELRKLAALCRSPELRDWYPVPAQALIPSMNVRDEYHVVSRNSRGQVVHIRPGSKVTKKPGVFVEILTGL